MTDSNSDSLVNYNRVPLIVVASVFTFLGTLIVFVRFYVRSFLRRSLGWDDYTIAIGWLSTIGFAGASAVGMYYGIGLFAADVGPQNIILVMKATFFLEIFYCLAIYFIKLSILFCYLRLSTALKDRLYVPTYISMAILSLQLVAGLIALLLQCRPISYLWDTNQPGSCFDTNAFFYFGNTFTIASDVVLLILPIPYLWRVNRTMSQKFALLGVFMIGVLGTISSGIRVYTIQLFTNATDLTYGSAPVNMWSFIEIDIGLACACGPALKGLFSRLRDPSHDKESENSSLDSRDIIDQKEIGIIG